MTLLIGLTGKRYVGKTTIADHFVKHHGFVKMHTFGAGLAAARGYFLHVTGDPDLAHRMTYGDLKDVPSEHLPDNAKPRVFLERFGAFMPRELGIDWTMGVELNKTRRQNKDKPIIVESVVYEADYFRERGGKIIRITRPGNHGPTGEKTDEAQAKIEADAEIFNTNSLDDLFRAVSETIEWLKGTN